jgi:hypothetical protein
MREGLLLGVGRARPPENYRDDEIIPIFLSVLDQWDAELSVTVKMRLNRCRYLANIARPRGPLLSKRDLIEDSDTPNPRTPPTDEEIFQGLEECMAEISAIGRARAAGQGEDES